MNGRPDDPANDKDRSACTATHRDVAEVYRTIGDTNVKVENYEGAAEAYQNADEHNQIANDRDGLDKQIS